jgi:hypothetical protein
MDAPTLYRDDDRSVFLQECKSEIYDRATRTPVGERGASVFSNYRVESLSTIARKSDDLTQNRTNWFQSVWNNLGDL